MSSKTHLWNNCWRSAKPNSCWVPPRRMVPLLDQRRLVDVAIRRRRSILLLGDEPCTHLSPVELLAGIGHTDTSSASVRRGCSADGSLAGRAVWRDIEQAEGKRERGQHPKDVRRSRGPHRFLTAAESVSTSSNDVIINGQVKCCVVVAPEAVRGYSVRRLV